MHSLNWVALCPTKIISYITKKKREKWLVGENYHLTHIGFKVRQNWDK